MSDKNDTRARTQPATVPRMTEAELRTFVDDLVSGRVFTTAHLQDPEDMRLVFMPLAFGALASYSEDEVRKIGVIWEYLDQAGPRSINGYPSFFSMRLMHIDDWKIAAEAARAERDRRKNITLPGGAT